MTLKERVGVHGVIIFRNGERYSPEIKNQFSLIERPPGKPQPMPFLKPGELVWIEYDKGRKAGFILCPLVGCEGDGDPPPASGRYLYEVKDEKRLMAIVDANPWTLERKPVN